MITGKTPYISTVSLLSRPVSTAAAGAVSGPTGSEDDVHPVTGTDSVHLSESGLHLLPAQAEQPDAARAARIQELKQAIEEKRYHVESRKIAAKLLSEASELMATLTGYPLDPLADADPAQSGSRQDSGESSAEDGHAPR
ncbi:MAG: flagellar biosynthesis anti-sigma factor FlgM [Lautropia sp.]|nr:flagellar biosynthesis anti-sigma factor FlgM [Lautropia sp.]